MTVVVKKLGGSVAVVIPKAIAREMELAEGAVLDINASEGGILLRKQGRRPRRPLSELIAQMDPKSYARNNRDLLRDPPVGREIG